MSAVFSLRLKEVVLLNQVKNTLITSTNVPWFNHTGSEKKNVSYFNAYIHNPFHVWYFFENKYNSNKTCLQTIPLRRPKRTVMNVLNTRYVSILSLHNNFG